MKFAAEAQTKVSLGQDVLSGLNDLDYSGGLTNHGAAIQQCQSTFAGSNDGGKNFILLVTDGVATTKVSTCQIRVMVASAQMALGIKFVTTMN